MQTASTSLPPEDFPWPFDGPDWRMAMGLRPLEPGRLLNPDERLPALLEERRRLLDTRPRDVLALIPGAEPAAREAASMLLESALAAYPHLYAAEGEGRVRGLAAPGVVDLATPNPLEAVGRLLPDDYCVVEERQNQWRLTAGVLCFPNRWRLGEKLGRAMEGVHQPVPLYAEKLAVPVDRFFGALAPGKSVWRTNWSLSDDPALFQPVETAHTDPDRTITPANAADRLYLRVERQTLTKLPGSGAMLFGIGTHQRPLSALTDAQARSLAGVLRTVPEGVARYKGLHRTGPLALDALER